MSRSHQASIHCWTGLEQLLASAEQCHGTGAGPRRRSCRRTVGVGVKVGCKNRFGQQVYGFYESETAASQAQLCAGCSCDEAHGNTSPSKQGQPRSFVGVAADKTKRADETRRPLQCLERHRRADESLSPSTAGIALVMFRCLVSHAVASPGAGVCDDAERLSEYVLQTHEPKDAEVGLEGIELVDATGTSFPSALQGSAIF